MDKNTELELIPDNYFSNNTGVDKTTIGLSFHISADYFDVNTITELLDIKPTSTIIKGEKIRLYNPNSTREYSFTRWDLAIQTEESLDINDPLNEIIKLLKTKKESFITIKQQIKDVSFMFSFVVYVENSKIPAIYFTPETIAFINSIPAEIDIDFYIYS